MFCPILLVALFGTMRGQISLPPAGSQVYSETPWDDFSVLEQLGESCNPLYGDEGEGVTVFIVDSGCRADHDEFSDLAPGQLKNFVITPSLAVFNETTVGVDVSGSGTHMASLLIGKTYGVAKKANVECIRVYDTPGTKTTETCLEDGIIMARNRAKELSGPSILVVTSSSTEPDATWKWFCYDLGGGIYIGEFCVHPYSMYCVDRVVNREDCHNTLDWALKQAAEDGLRVIVSAGNDGEDACLHSPARVSRTGREYGLTIGTVDSTDNLWLAGGTPSTNIGPCVNAYTRGLDVPGAWPFFEQGKYMRNGARTSSAAVLAAGVAARILNANPTFRTVDVMNVLINAAGVDHLVFDPFDSVDRPLVKFPCLGDPKVTPAPTQTPAPPQPTLPPLPEPTFDIPDQNGSNTDPTVPPEDPTDCFIDPLGYVTEGQVAILALKDATVEKAQIKGRTIVVHDGAFSSSQLRTSGTVQETDPFVLRVGNDLKLDRTIIHSSSAICGSNLDKEKHSKAVPTGDISCAPQYFDYASLAELTEFFISQYGALESTGSYDGTDKRMTGTDQLMNVFTFDGADSFTGVRIIDVPSNSSTVINIRGASPALVSYKMPKKLYGPNTLINFPDVAPDGVVTVDRSWIPGTILTRGTLRLSNSHVRGQIVCGRLEMDKTVVELDVFEGHPFYDDCVQIGAQDPAVNLDRRLKVKDFGGFELRM
mmetsp:Transcript_5055/g.12201  ORF Transcript_5055/g.12201 Transcript_5055/m.12201 type:complete len:708 (-) Transcript_5055:69-2192(-)